MRARDDHTSGLWQYKAVQSTDYYVTERFILNNNPPSIPYLIYPVGGERIFTGEVDLLNIKFNSSDSEAFVNYSIFVSDNSGSSYSLLENLREESKRTGVPVSAIIKIRISQNQKLNEVNVQNDQ